MNGEFLSAIERIERQKGISKEILLEAIESALVSAARKVIDDPEISKEDISVQIDKETGAIHVYSDDEEIRNEKFGRIAAQTAKQVMIQKIREAERDVVHEKYSLKVGTIINGQVHRFERGNIIVELDDAEALLPRSQQIAGEKFRQGEDIRALLLKVERGTSGSDIILSRADKDFVKHLFSLEVPEISDGIVEIKGIAREAGDRSKVAVWSKDEKVDAVGACVGMKGSRVRDIVRELSGERIDVVRWNEDIREYIPAAVSPAEISKMVIDRKIKRITITVPQDQLSILIGKKGRNIRLASKLVGWDLKAESLEEEIQIATSSLEELSEPIREVLIDAGFDSVEKICNTSREELLNVEGLEEEDVENVLEIAREVYLNGQARKEVGEEKDLQGKTKEDEADHESDLEKEEVASEKPAHDVPSEDPENSEGQDDLKEKEETTDPPAEKKEAVSEETAKRSGEKDLDAKDTPREGRSDEEGSSVSENQQQRKES